MVRSDDVDQVYERALENGARISGLPTEWTVGHPEGLGDIIFRTTCFFDPEGTYVEVSKKLFTP